ncbi:MAG: aminotransferase class III-fold pyridoxal phosphate-dependent enzyme, partial [Candidatus Margulisiibacteriota bacterium]
FKVARELCNRYGALFIADEVQTGGHRTGPFFASSHTHFSNNCSPDIITLGKAINPMVPVSMVLVRQSIGNALVPGTHGSTWGGNPFAMAISNATLDYYKDINLENQMITIGKTLMKTLQFCKENNNRIADVRGLGSMIAITFNTANDAIYFKKRLATEGSRQKLSVSNDLIKDSPHFNYEQLTGKPINGIALKLTEENRTMRVNPTILTPTQLNYLCKLYEGALIENAPKEALNISLSSNLPLNTKQNALEIEQSHLNISKI